MALLKVFFNKTVAPDTASPSVFFTFPFMIWAEVTVVNKKDIIIKQ
jgi:hypothetical protein